MTKTLYLLSVGKQQIIKTTLSEGFIGQLTTMSCSSLNLIITLLKIQNCHTVTTPLNTRQQQLSSANWKSFQKSEMLSFSSSSCSWDATITPENCELVHQLVCLFFLFNKIHSSKAVVAGSTELVWVSL